MIIFSFIINICYLISVTAVLKFNNTNNKNFTNLCLSICKITDQRTNRNVILLSDEMNRLAIGESLLKLLQEPKMILSSSNLTNQEGLFILFGRKGQSYKELLEKLSLNYDTKFLVVWTRPNAKFLDVQILFDEFWSFEITNVVSLLEMKYGGIYLFTYYPYTRTRCSDPGSPVFLDSWNAENNSFTKNVEIFAPKKLSNLQSCPLQCSGTHTPPDSIISETGNNTYELGGLGGLIFNFVVQNLNFTPVITRITDTTNSYEGVYSNETSVLMKDIISRKVDIGFGKFSRSTDMHRDIIFAKETGVDCFTWAVPFRAGHAPPIWKTHVDEFYGLTWILIIISLIIAVIILFILSNFAKKEHKEYKSVTYIMLFVISTFLSSQLKITPRSSILRIFVAHWFLYSLVIITAYQASLGSIVTVPVEISNIQTVNEILESNLAITGSPRMYYVLNASTNTSKQVAELLKRFEVQPPGEFLPVMRRVVIDRNVVVFATQRLLMYSNSKLKDINITDGTAYIVPDCLIKSPSSPMLLRRGSPYRIPIDIILNRLVESGIIEHWSALQNRKTDNNKAQFFQLHFRHLKGAFIVLFVGEVLASFVFVIEIISYKWLKTLCKTPEVNETEQHTIPFTL